MEYDPADSSNWNIYSDEDYQRDELITAELNESSLVRKNDVINYVSSCESNESIREKAIQKIIINAKEEMVRRYSRLEKLPYDFVYAAKQKNGMNLLINSFIRNYTKVEFSPDIESCIKRFIDDLDENPTEEIVYYRVKRIRDFICEYFEASTGLNSEIDLPAEEMRVYLSAFRLHLNLKDYHQSDFQFLRTQMKRNLIEYKKEMSREGAVTVSAETGKKYFPRWKARHMKTLMYFAPEETRALYQKLLKIDSKIPRLEFIDIVSDLLSGKG